MVSLVSAQVRQLQGHSSGAVRKAGAATAALTLAAVYLPPLRGALGLAPLGAGELALAVLTTRLTAPRTP